MHKRIIAVVLLHLLVLLVGSAILQVWLGGYYIYLALIPMIIIGWYRNKLVDNYPQDAKIADSILKSSRSYYGRLALYAFILILASIFIIAYLTR